MQQGRRTASLKASYEAINSVNEFGIVKELAGAAKTAIQAVQQHDHANNKKKQKYLLINLLYTKTFYYEIL